MPNMHSEWLRQLPYLVHTNRELGLMLRGYKPLAYFMDVIGQEPEIWFNIGECSTDMLPRAV
jgi:hypothetical protein